MNSTNIYQVKGTSDTNSYHIAFCKGNPADIKRYFENEGGYGLQIDLIKVLEITPQSANEKQNLKLKKLELEKELKNINEKLKYN